MRISDWSSDVCSSDLDSGAVRHATEHHADLLAELVDEDADGVGLVEVGSELAQGLRHEAGLEADVAVAHVALDLGAGGEGGHGVDHHDVDGAGAHEHVGDLEGLPTPVGLGDQQPVDRSEEPTSELQPLMRLSYAVFCFKKKKKKKRFHIQVNLKTKQQNNTHNIKTNTHLSQIITQKKNYQTTYLTNFTN